MKPQRLDPETVELLSRLTGQELADRDIPALVIFIAALLSFLLGVVRADRQVTAEEKQQFRETIDRFIPLKGDIRRLTQLLWKGFQEQNMGKDLSLLSQVTRKLAANLTLPEKLLLLGFGYQMSAADGSMDESERKYIEAIATRLQIDKRYLSVWEASFTNSEASDRQAINEMAYLLDPVRFQSLDPVFVDAASYLRDRLPQVEPETETTASLSVSHGTLEAFQKQKEEALAACYPLIKIFEELNDRNAIPDRLLEEVRQTYLRFESNSFRLAVIGEFSKGKSTLLNALLGEKIQPTRAIACSGTITVLKYGKTKRAICYYKDGTTEEIPFTEYQERASISREAARQGRSDELLQSQLKEIVLETPDLDFCRNGVAIIDSPGLNEHPDRTAVTQEILKNTDAIVFLTNATQLLTQEERNLVGDIRKQLNGDRHDEPASNIFVAVNFMDLLDEEDDREDVEHRTLNFFLGKSPIVSERSRIHFISAKAALNAMLAGQETEELKQFNSFVSAIEQFLTVDRGAVEMQQFSQKIDTLGSSAVNTLQVYQGKLKEAGEESQKKQQEILDLLGDVSGRVVKVQFLADKLFEEIQEPIDRAWQSWAEGLGDRMADKTQNWSSQYNLITSRKKLIADYIQQFNDDLSGDLNSWVENEVKERILQSKLNILDREIERHLEAIAVSLKTLDRDRHTESHDWVFLKNITEEADWLGSLSKVGMGIGILIPGIVFGPVLTTILGIAFGGGLVGKGVLQSIFGSDEKVRETIFVKGFEAFENHLDEVIDKIDETIASAFDDRLHYFEEVTENAISFYENRLEQQQAANNKTARQREEEIAWIDDRIAAIESAKSAIVAIFSHT